MSAAITDWESERSAFAAAVELLKNPVNRSPVNTSKKSLLSKFRSFVQGSLIHTSRVTNADLRSMNLPVRKSVHTPHPAPKGRPTNNRQHTIIAEKQETGKREKPVDAAGVKYCWGANPSLPTQSS
jgi:hypothetical protein